MSLSLGGWGSELALELEASEEEDGGEGGGKECDVEGTGKHSALRCLCRTRHEDSADGEGDVSGGVGRLVWRG